MLVIRNLIYAVVYHIVNMLYRHARDETTLVPCLSNYVTLIDSFSEIKASHHKKKQFKGCIFAKCQQFAQQLGLH